MTLKAIEFKDKKLRLLDQTKLPLETAYRTYDDYEQIAEAIEEMIVRGAPAIGITAAYGVVIGAYQYTTGDFKSHMHKVIGRLENTRPTAVNLTFALNRMKEHISDDVDEAIKQLEREADLIFQEDLEINKAIGKHFFPFITDDAVIITHCNPGALATSDYGTATAPLYLAHEQGVRFKVYSDETRPRFQGALTAYELASAGIDVTTIIDSAAATIMQQENVTAVIVGCDRVARNGDVVNKIGTLPLAITAKYFDVPFYVAAPTPSFDITVQSGQDIPIEERNRVEVTHFKQQQITYNDINIYNPAFDITPAHLITGLVTEKGIIKAEEQAIEQLFKQNGEH